MTRRSWRIPDIEQALKAKYGDIAILVLDDMVFFNYYNNTFDGYWFKLFKNVTHEIIVGIIVEGMDDTGFHIEEAPYCGTP